MGKSINSRALLLLAREKAKNQPVFGSFDELQDLSIIEQMLFFCLLNIEGLYEQGRIDKDSKNHYESMFEKASQELARTVFPLQKTYDQYEMKLQKSLLNNEYADAALYLAMMLDFSRQQAFEGKYFGMVDFIKSRKEQ